MTDSDSAADWMIAYQERLERERAEAHQAMGKACDALAELGATEVRIEYDGYGDSGAVEGVMATGPAGDVEIPADFREELISAAERLLPDGWENNTGAFGELVLDVAHRRLTREHNWRVETSEYDEEVWEL